MNARTFLCPVLFAFALGAVVPGRAIGQAIGLKTRVDVTGTDTAPANETSMASSEANPLEIVASWNDYRLGSAKLGVGLSLDGGETWTDQLLRPEPIFQSTTEGDPMTAADPRTGTLWVGAISFDPNGGVFVARKDPGSASFNPVVMAAVTGTADKGWMAAGPDPLDPDLTRLYIAYNQGLLISTDMGDTWTGPTPLTAGLGFLPRVGPNGELYIAYWDFSFGERILVSLDGGVTFGPSILAASRLDTWGTNATRVPGDARVVPMHGLAVDPNDGTLYYVYHDSQSLQPNGYDLQVWLTTSVDQGTTWSVPTVINTDSVVPQDQFFPWLEVDRVGRLQLLFYSGAAFAQDDTDALGRFHAVYSFSEDGGATWTESQLSTSPLDTLAAFPNGVFIGDYLGMSTAGGRALPLYLDTTTGDSDIFTQGIVHGTGTTFCTGLACPCGNDGAGFNGEGCKNPTGDGVLLSATGSTLTSDVVFHGTGFPPPGTPAALVIRSPSRQGAALFGDGLLCLQAPVVRMGSRFASGGSVSVPIGHGAGAGVFHYQMWYRSLPLGFCDPSAGFNLSNGMTLVWP